MLDIQLSAIERDLRALARHQAGCQALMGQYGMGELSALVTLVELGDVTRMHASRQAVRMAGLDIGVHRSDRHAQLGKLTRQGSAPLRWALYEAAQSACAPASPDYADYHALKDRGLSHTRASLTIARKLARRSYHLLRALGPAALEPPDTFLTNRSDQAHTSTMRPQACGQLQQRSRHPRPAWRPTKDRAAAVAPPERPINHQVTGRQHRQPRTQIRQGVHGANTTRRYLTTRTSTDKRSWSTFPPFRRTRGRSWIRVDAAEREIVIALLLAAVPSATMLASSRLVRQRMNTKHSVEVRLGNPIPVASEREFLGRLRHDLHKLGVTARIFANFRAGREERQIDFVVVTNHRVVQLDEKVFPGPVVDGPTNGPWTVGVGANQVQEWRNPLVQALDNTYALSDAMHWFSAAAGAPGPSGGKFYGDIDTVVCAYPTELGAVSAAGCSLIARTCKRDQRRAPSARRPARPRRADR